MLDDDAAFEEIYGRYHPAILAYCRRRTSPADAQDATAEVFLVVWRRMADRPPEDQLRAWLYGIAYRVVGHQWRSDTRRRRLRRKVVSITEARRPALGTEAPEAIVVRREQDRRVLEAAARLRPVDQEILRLAGWERLPHAEIAVILDISPAAVDQRFHRAKRRLAREYDRLNDAGDGPRTTGGAS